MVTFNHQIWWESVCLYIVWQDLEGLAGLKNQRQNHLQNIILDMRKFISLLILSRSNFKGVVMINTFNFLASNIGRLGILKGMDFKDQ